MLIQLTRTLIATSCFALTLLASSIATAGGMPPFESAAREYRSAVQAFERHVHRLRYLDRYDVKLVERLENAACDFYGTSFRPSDVARVMYYWNEIELLEPRVASAIFGRECYPVNIELAECWKQVTCAHAELALRLNPPFIVDRNGRTLRPGYGIPSHTQAHDFQAPQGFSPYNQHPGTGGYRATIAVPRIGSQVFPIEHDLRRERATGHGGYPVENFGPQTSQRVDGSELGSIIIGSLLQRAFSR